jgi:hypothetical protein
LTAYQQTLFSTSFFNFTNKAGETIVASWIWLYAAVAFALTTLVMISWYIFSTRSARNMKSQFQIAHQSTDGLRALPETTVVPLANLPNGRPSAMRTFTSVAAAQPGIAASQDLSRGARVGLKMGERATVGKAELLREGKAFPCMTCGSADV